MSPLSALSKIALIKALALVKIIGSYRQTFFTLQPIHKDLV